MKTFIKITLILTLIVAFAVLSIRCTSEEESNCTVNFYLTDAPANYKSINIEIIGLKIITNNEENEINVELERPGIYNLLDYTAGIDTLLGSITLPEGKISQIRLILGDNNSIETTNDSMALKIPSGSESGLKIKVNQTVTTGDSLDLTIDFDASRSVVAQGNGKYLLKPVLRLISPSNDGSIKGKISPAEARPNILAITGTDTIGGIANEMGQFEIAGLYGGSYTVVITPTNGIAEKTIENVVVKEGKQTNLGNINLDK